MAKSGEIAYLRNVGPAAAAHAAHKPFSDPECSKYLAEVAAVLALLPRPPARLLDLGCGTGWTSVFFARAGYDVLGVDLAPDMIAHARRNGDRAGPDRLHFLVCDYEDLPFEGEFDAVVFFDALHHAVAEDLAVAAAFRALRPGGVCVTSEPGEGHSRSPQALRAVRAYGVTEKDMPPARVMALGRAAGFRRCRVFPHAFDLHAPLYGDRPEVRPGWLRRLVYGPVARLLGVGPGVFATRLGALYYLKHVAKLLRGSVRQGGIVVMEK